MKKRFSMVAAAFLIVAAASAANRKPSVLFINIDDLNDWNTVLQGHPQAITPNIQRLADRGVTFSRAICSSPVCYPSRTSLFTGIHPVRSGAISNFNWKKPWRFYVHDAVTLPGHFADNGWTTYGASKNFHGGNKEEFDHYFPQQREPKAVKGSGHSAGPLGWGVADIPYEQMPDHKTVSWTVQQIEDATKSSFFSIGIYKPHVKWTLPQSCFDKYPVENFQLPEMQEGDLDDLPERLKLLAHNEAKFGTGFHAALKEEGQDKLWARAYLASVTFADDQLGRLLDAWDASPMAKEGYVVLWSDHGFMLGEKEGWGKFKPWYDASRCNMIFAGPGIARGVICDKAVSLLDLYPTLVDLFNLPEPRPQELDGNSLVPLLNNPATEWDRPVVMSHEEDGIRYDSIMDNRYRMTRLITGETELYDHQTDPNEWKNLAPMPEYREIIQRLENHLTFTYPKITRDGWIEAEDVPCQTSADYRRRGNYHYPLKESKASGGAVLCAQLIQGPKSYLEFVVDLPKPGSYSVSADLQHVDADMDIHVSAGAVTDDALQASAEAPLAKELKSIPAKGASGKIRKHVLGSIPCKEPGLHLIRFMSMGEEPCELRVDRLQVSPLK